jgi:hypothetical protein
MSFLSDDNGDFIRAFDISGRLSDRPPGRASLGIAMLDATL